MSSGEDRYRRKRKEREEDDRILREIETLKKRIETRERPYCGRSRSRERSRSSRHSRSSRAGESRSRSVSKYREHHQHGRSERSDRYRQGSRIPNLHKNPDVSVT